jgi:hypothetical protein
MRGRAEAGGHAGLRLAEIGDERAGGRQQRAVAVREAEPFQVQDLVAAQQLLASVGALELPVAPVGADGAARPVDGEQLPAAREQQLRGLHLPERVGHLLPRHRAHPQLAGREVGPCEAESAARRRVAGEGGEEVVAAGLEERVGESRAR